MIKDARDKFPLWVDTKEYDKILITNDFDSLFSGKILEQQSDCNIGYFFNNEKVYFIDDDKDTPKKLVAVDCDLVYGRCWGNHVTLISDKDSVNERSANLNNLYGINAKGNYTKKYAGSTAIQILSYYNYKLADFTEEQKKVILCIDSHYIGLKNDKFKAIQHDWLKILEYDELIDIVEKTSIEEFEQLQNKYNLKGKIQIDRDNYLHTDIKLDLLSELFNMDLKLPQEQFTKKKLEFATATQYIYNKNTKKELTDRNMFVYVQTYKKSGLFNYYK